MKATKRGAAKRGGNGKPAAKKAGKVAKVRAAVKARVTQAKRAATTVRARPQLSAEQVRMVEAAARGQVSDIMTKNAITVRPDTTLDTVIQLMLDRQISGLPVVDDGGAPVGVISKTDLVRDQYLQHGTEEHDGPGVELPGRRGVKYSPGPGYHVEEGDVRTAQDVMTPMALTIADSAPISSAAKMMASGGIHRMPVVSTSGKVVGVVSAMDVVGWVAGFAS